MNKSDIFSNERKTNTTVITSINKGDSDRTIGIKIPLSHEAMSTLAFIEELGNDSSEGLAVAMKLYLMYINNFKTVRDACMLMNRTYIADIIKEKSLIALTDNVMEESPKVKARIIVVLCELYLAFTPYGKYLIGRLLESDDTYKFFDLLKEPYIRYLGVELFPYDAEINKKVLDGLKERLLQAPSYV